MNFFQTISTSYKIRSLISVIFFLSNFSYLSAGNTVKINTDKQKVKGSGATVGQIVMANSVDGKIKAKWSDLTVGSSQITDGSLAAADLGDNSVTSIKIQNNSIESEDIADGSILAPKMAPNALPVTYVVDIGGSGHYTSIQSALSALPSSGGKVFIQPGTYNENLTVPVSNVTIEGCGLATTISTSSGDGINALSASNISIRNLNIIVNGIGNDGILFGLPNCEASNCSINTQSKGISGNGANNLRLFANTFTNTGINIQNSSNVLIRDNQIDITISAADGTGIDILSTCSQISIIGNHLNVGNQFFGIQLSGTASSFTTVSNNIISGTTGIGILSEHSCVTISGNIVKLAFIAGGDSIVLGSTAFRNAVTGNYCIGNINSENLGDGDHTFYGNIADNILSDASTSQPNGAGTGIDDVNDLNRIF